LTAPWYLVDKDCDAPIQGDLNRLKTLHNMNFHRSQIEACGMQGCVDSLAIGERSTSGMREAAAAIARFVCSQASINLIAYKLGENSVILIFFLLNCGTCVPIKFTCSQPL
jgi:hypothetical protein